jgi:hypothetical protein
MLRLNVAVERQITVVENRVTAPSHADERLAEHGALDQLFGRLGELANGKVGSPLAIRPGIFPGSGVLNNIWRFGASVANAAIKEGEKDELDEIGADEAERPLTCFWHELCRQGDQRLDDCHHLVELLKKLFGPWRRHQAFRTADHLIAEQRPQARPATHSWRRAGLCQASQPTA